MLKTKLAYMALGAVIASFGYFIGTLNNLNAEDEVARVKKLIVSEEISVENESGVVKIMPDSIAVIDRSAAYTTAIFSGSISIVTVDPTGKSSLHFGATANPIPYIETDPVRAAEILNTEQPTIELRKPDGKRITLQIADEASIKLSNGGLKSKTVAVD